MPEIQIDLNQLARAHYIDYDLRGMYEPELEVFIKVGGNEETMMLTRLGNIDGPILMYERCSLPK